MGGGGGGGGAVYCADNKNLITFLGHFSLLC